MPTNDNLIWQHIKHWCVPIHEHFGNPGIITPTFEETVENDYFLPTDDMLYYIDKIWESEIDNPANNPSHPIHQRHIDNMIKRCILSTTQTCPHCGENILVDIKPFSTKNATSTPHPPTCTHASPQTNTFSINIPSGRLVIAQHAKHLIYIQHPMLTDNNTKDRQKIAQLYTQKNIVPIYFPHQDYAAPLYHTTIDHQHHALLPQKNNSPAVSCNNTNIDNMLFLLDEREYQHALQSIGLTYPGPDDGENIYVINIPPGTYDVSYYLGYDEHWHCGITIKRTNDASNQLQYFGMTIDEAVRALTDDAEHSPAFNIHPTAAPHLIRWAAGTQTQEHIHMKYTHGAYDPHHYDPIACPIPPTTILHQLTTKKPNNHSYYYNSIGEFLRQHEWWQEKYNSLFYYIPKHLSAMTIACRILAVDQQIQEIHKEQQNNRPMSQHAFIHIMRQHELYRNQLWSAAVHHQYTEIVHQHIHDITNALNNYISTQHEESP